MMYCRTVTTLAALLLLHSVANAQSRPVVLLKSVLGDLGHVLSAPARIDRHSALSLLGASAITTGVVFFVDKPLNNKYVRDNSNFPLGLPDLISSVGDLSEPFGAANTNYFIAGSTGSIFLLGLARQDSKMTSTAGLMLEAVLFTKLITPIGKRLVGRARPFTNQGPRDFSLFKLNAKRPQRSFPSGHTSTIFSLMTVLAKQYEHWWVDVPAYGFGAAVAFQRIESNNHWLSDTLIGGLIGYEIANTLVKRHRDKQPGSYSLYPYLKSDHAGVKVHIALR